MTRPLALTVNAGPGSLPVPGVGTTSTSRTSFAKTLRVAAPVAFSVQTLGSLTRIERRLSIGTSVNVIYHRALPTACISTRLKLRQLGWIWVRPTPFTHICVDGGRSGFTLVEAR